MKEKTYKIIGDVRKMSHEQWLQLRKKSIGGSDISAAIGLNRWKSPFQLWAEKTGRVDNAVKKNDYMYWGNVMEPILRQEFQKRTGYEVSESNYIFSSAENSFLTANLDGYVHLENGEYAVLEIKTAGSYADADWNNGVPIEYFCQVQHYMYVTGLSKAFVVVLIGGNNFKYVEVERDEDTIATMVKLASSFWQYVAEDIPPSVNEKDNDVLLEIYPSSKSKVINLPAEFDDVVAQLVAAKDAMTKAKKLKEEAEANLKAYMGDADTAVTKSYKITWKTTERTTFSGSKAKTFLTAEQIDQCSEKSVSRTFKISKNEDKHK